MKGYQNIGNSTTCLPLEAGPACVDTTKIVY